MVRTACIASQKLVGPDRSNEMGGRGRGGGGGRWCIKSSE